MTALAVALLAALAAFGVLVTVSAWTTPPATRTTGRTPWLTSELLARAGGAVVAGALGLVATGWVVAGVAAAAGGWAAVAMWQRRGSGGADREQARIEALASWCEQLRDLLSADNGIQGTIEASAVTCPAALRPEVSRLATRLTRQAPEIAVRQFATEVDDPSGDLVASVILLAMSRSGRTADLLSELAATIRERATMRLRVEADRAGQRSEAKFVLGFGVAVVVGVIIFGRGTSFLAAYDTATGQLVLALVVAMYGFGMWWLSRLVRFERPARFLSNPDQFGITEGWSGSNPRVGPR
jgi:tight adherence protein B